MSLPLWLLLYWVAIYVAVGAGYALCFVPIINEETPDEPMDTWEIFQVIFIWPFYVWLGYMEGRK